MKPYDRRGQLAPLWNRPDRHSFLRRPFMGHEFEKRTIQGQTLKGQGQASKNVQVGLLTKSQEAFSGVFTPLHGGICYIPHTPILMIYSNSCSFFLLCGRI
jgi:hypothetical protein